MKKVRQEKIPHVLKNGWDLAFSRTGQSTTVIFRGLSASDFGSVTVSKP